MLKLKLKLNSRLNVNPRHTKTKIKFKVELKKLKLNLIYVSTKFNQDFMHFKSFKEIFHKALREKIKNVYLKY